MHSAEERDEVKKGYMVVEWMKMYDNNSRLNNKKNLIFTLRNAAPCSNQTSNSHKLSSRRVSGCLPEWI